MSKVLTNNRWYDFKQRDDVPKKVLAADFDWTKEEQGYFKYHGTWYHISQFLRGGEPGWDGYHATSGTTAVLIMLSKDKESYKVGSWRL